MSIDLNIQLINCLRRSRVKSYHVDQYGPHIEFFDDTRKKSIEPVVSSAPVISVATHEGHPEVDQVAEIFRKAGVELEKTNG